MQAAIVSGNAVNFVNVPIPAGTIASDFIGGASTTALSNGGFAVMYWGNSASDNGGVGSGGNDNLPGYYIQIFTSTGVTVGSLIAENAAGNNFNPAGTIAADPHNGGFVVSYLTNDTQNIVIQRFSNAGSAGDTFTLSGSVPFVSVDALGDILESYDDAGSHAAYTFIPNSATTISGAGVLTDQQTPIYETYANVLSGGFLGFYFAGTNNTELMAQSISTAGVLGTPVSVANVGTVGTNNFVWTAQALSNGGYILTLEPSGASGYDQYPGTSQVILVGSDLSSASTTIYSLTASGGGAAKIGPWAAVGPNDSLQTYTVSAGNGVTANRPRSCPAGRCWAPAVRR